MKTRNFVFKTRNFVFKTRKFVLQMRNFVSKMRIFVLKTGAFVSFYEKKSSYDEKTVLKSLPPVMSQELMEAMYRYDYSNIIMRLLVGSSSHSLFDSLMFV